MENGKRGENSIEWCECEFAYCVDDAARACHTFLHNLILHIYSYSKSHRASQQAVDTASVKTYNWNEVN